LVVVVVVVRLVSVVTAVPVVPGGSLVHKKPLKSGVIDMGMLEVATFWEILD